MAAAAAPSRRFFEFGSQILLRALNAVNWRKRPPEGAFRHDPADLKGPKKRAATRFSLVVPCHNVENYLDDFFHSIFAQTVAPECFEVIAVDDGSTDGTARRIQYWADLFPDRIRYIWQHNQGQAAARNAGLELATGDFVSFPDPDDFFAFNYLEKVDEEIIRARERPLAVVSCKLVYFKELKHRYEDNHPLRYRFEKQRTIRPADDLQDYMQLSVATAWLRLDPIKKDGLRFDPRIVPTFEDGHFVNRFLLLNSEAEVAFLKEPVYYYRKREDQSSTLDAAKQRREYYLDALRYGYLDLLQQALEKTGLVPRFIQRTVLYDIVYRFYQLMDHPERAAFLTEEERLEFWALLQQIFALIDCETIKTYDLSLDERHKVGLLGLMKQARPSPATVQIRQQDKAKGLVQFSFYSSEPGNDAVALVNGRPAPLYFKSRCRSMILDRPYFYEHYFWAALEPADTIDIRIGDEICPLHYRGTPLGTRCTMAELAQALAPPTWSARSLPRGLRAAADAKAKRKYGDCWLLFDRDDKADDNAEHLYRYLRSIGKADKAFFLLRTDSPDWERLKREGFQLLPFHSPEHHIALLHAKFLISSDIVDSLTNPPPEISDLVTYRFAFLNHGVIKDDISRWLNSKDMALFVTSTPSEYESIAAEDSEYKFSAKEVVLTGLARHDALLTQPLSSQTLLIMPTWRHYLAGKLAKLGARRGASAAFAKSDYVIHWKRVLHSPRLKDLADRHGLKLAFCPHANLVAQIGDFELPTYVEVVNPLATESLQPLFAKSALLLTDYSSVAFEFAYLEKPVIYYQFDAESFFGGGHTSQTGYFDYKREGFGPVVATEEELFASLEASLSGEILTYAERRQAAFPYRDGKCCERLYRSLIELDQPLRA
jgi:glycosyltransferase involved in cell wall biosynthesis/CDP-glycerol glycerophosphotransferase (TagB/SpsB family)